MRQPLLFGTLGLAALALSLTLTAGRPAAAAGGALDGKVFAGTTGETGKATGDKDVLVFRGGTFRSTACDTYGFGSAPYTASRNPDGSTGFLATTSSPKEGTIHWRGRVRGDAIAATYVWEKAGQRPISYWFKGTIKKAA
ncbi:MAG TPA: hypothetical protein VIH93_00425 [Thermoanaerobaculia bacterium]|jgi:hypothetical protein